MFTYYLASVPYAPFHILILMLLYMYSVYSISLCFLIQVERWSNIVAVVVIALISGIPIAYGQEDCPQGAEFIISFDSVVSVAEFRQNIPDPNLTFFRNVLKFSEQEIQTATQSAIEYFNTTFGLDFSESEPNQQSQQIFQNASFSVQLLLLQKLIAGWWVGVQNQNVLMFILVGSGSHFWVNKCYMGPMVDLRVK